MTIYTVLHISDVHFGSSKTKDLPLITSRLIEAAHDHVKKYSHRQPDICIFSGDLAQSGITEQLKEGEQWLQKLIEPWGCKTFIVPGNHDVVRPTQDANHEIETLRLARSSQKEYNKLRARVGCAHLMKEFFEWHDATETKQRLNLVSDWSNSKFGCFYSHRINKVEVVVIGLNSALMSFSDDDKGNLIIDETCLNEIMSKAKSDEKFTIAVTHHPIGCEKKTRKKWLAKWNSQAIEELFLQRTGPHVYLHGHLHDDQGTSVNYSTGQNLTLFSAGACYDTEKRYPKSFSFYDINLGGGKITPYLYSYSQKRGCWVFDTERSHTIQAVLPQPISMTEQSAIERLGEFRDLIKELVIKHQDNEKILREAIPKLAPELNSMLNPGEQHQLLSHQYKRGYKYLLEYIEEEKIRRITDQHERTQQLNNIKNYVEHEKLENAISLLQKFPVRFPKILLTALVLSENQENWDKAKELFEHATPWHYLTLSYGYWSEFELDNAIFFAEKALSEYDSWDQSDLKNIPKYKIWNNLAYFYADAEKHEKQAAALKFAEDATKEVASCRPRDDKNFANFLDTWGYVQIVFAENTSTLKKGIKLCETARRLGNDFSYYFKHIAKAKLRSLGLPKSD